MNLSFDSELPFREIQEAPDGFGGNAVMIRLIDGLGFRFYWATEGLRDSDLEFRPNADARTTRETLDHVHGLAQIIYFSMHKLPTERNTNYDELSFERLRREVLNMLHDSREVLVSSTEADLEQMKVVFKRGERRSEFSFWNMINGPIADALWHVGQVVSFRRSSGNPFDSNANVFQGKLRSK